MGNKKIPHMKTHLLNQSFYGKTKLVSENLIKNFSKGYFKSICLRYFNVVGSNYKNKLGEVHNHRFILFQFYKKLLKKTN